MQLTERVDPEEVRGRLSAALPDGVDLSVIGEYAVKSTPNVGTMTIGQAITFADFLVLLAPAAEGVSVAFAADEEEEGEAGGSRRGGGGESGSEEGDGDDEPAGASGADDPSLREAVSPVSASASESPETHRAESELPPPTRADFESWVQGALALGEFLVEKRSKANPKKVAAVDQRPSLLSAHVCADAVRELRAAGDEAGAVILGRCVQSPLAEGARHFAIARRNALRRLC